MNSRKKALREKFGEGQSSEWSSGKGAGGGSRRESPSQTCVCDGGRRGMGRAGRTSVRDSKTQCAKKTF